MTIITLGIISVVALVSNTNDSYATASTLSLSIDNTTVGLDISSISSTGTFAKSSNSTISASTNNATGYTLSIISANGSGGSDSTNYNKLINTEDNTAKLSSISSSITEETFSALNGTAYNNMWGYLPSQYIVYQNDEKVVVNNTTSNPSFLPAPNSTTGDILNITECANNTPNTTCSNSADEYTLAIGARVDNTTKIGSYTNTFNVILVANAITYSIIYDDTTITDMPADINTGLAMTETVNVSSNTPIRAGYTFIGWCTTTPTKNSNGIDTCPSPATTYSAGDPLTLNQQSTSNSFHLYAMWSGDYTIGALLASGTVYMQDFANMSLEMKGKILNSMTTGTAYTLTDKRDSNTYYVAKLKDGNVWMLDNLRLDLTSVSLANLQGNTNASYYALNCLKNGGCSSPYSKNSVVNGVNGNWSNSYEIPYINTAYKNSPATSYGNGSGRYGIYYNYCATSAGSYCYDISSGIDVANTLLDSPEDVCPIGWRLPTGGSDGEFKILYNNYNTTLVATDPASLQYNLSTLLSGTFDSNVQYDLTSGRWWSSTFIYTYGMRFLYITASNVLTEGYGDRSGGNTIRCLLR